MLREAKAVTFGSGNRWPQVSAPQHSHSKSSSQKPRVCLGFNLLWTVVSQQDTLGCEDVRKVWEVASGRVKVGNVRNLTNHWQFAASQFIIHWKHKRYFSIFSKPCVHTTMWMWMKDLRSAVHQLFAAQTSTPWEACNYILKRWYSPAF